MAGSTTARRQPSADRTLTRPEPHDTTTPSTALDGRGIALAVLAVAAAIFLARYMQEVIIPLVLAGLLFYALDPFVDRLQRWRLPRLIGAALVLVIVVAGLGSLAYSLRNETSAVIEDLPVAARQLRQMFRSGDRSAPTAIDKLQQAADEISETAAVASGKPPVERGVTRVQVEDARFNVMDYVWSSSLGLLGLVGQAIIILLLTFFLLVSDDLFKRKLVEIIGPTLTRKRVTVEILNEIASQIQRFVLVQIFTSAVVGVVTWLALWWAGLEHPAVWGLAAGVLNSIPYFGPMIVTAGLTVIAFLQFETIWMAAGIGALALAITSLEGWLLTPLWMGRVAEMNKVALFAGLLFWSWLWGVPGMLLAVPMMMSLKAVCDRVEDLQPIGKLLGE